MENNIFKSVAFGGFDKQDVIHYIEQAARQSAEIQERLQQENDDLRARIQALEEQSAEQERQIRAAEDQRRSLEQQLAKEHSARQALEEEKAQLLPQAQEAQRLRPEAEAYAQFRDRVGDIECEAHQRAAALEHTTMARMRQASDTFQAQYQAAMATFETASAHVTSELRKIEVTLSQLPRTMDRTGAELKELKTLLDGNSKERS